MTAVDLFCGARGWEASDDSPVTDALGIDNDPAACATSEAAGFDTLRADITALDPADFAGAEGLIASPPCQTFSMAGKGAGRRALEQVLTGIERVVAGHRVSPGDYDDQCTALVLEPLHWALELEPDWICWEQVPTVLPVWEACAEALRADGYHAVTGLLHAEQYGVPQTRKRAVLLAARRPVALPVPTHSRYHPRNPAKLDPGVLPWVSMAQALGWEASASPEFRGTGRVGKFRNRSADEPAGVITGKATAMWAMRSNYGTGGDPAARGERTLDQPAPTVTSHVDRNLWQMASAGATARYTAGQVPRDLDLPAATITGKGTASWTPKELDGEHSGKTSVRVTVQEAAILQSFPAGHPWQGTRTKQYQQVGNAIPPTLAAACLRALGLGRLTEERAA